LLSEQDLVEKRHLHRQGSETKQAREQDTLEKRLNGGTAGNKGVVVASLDEHSAAS